MKTHFNRSSVYLHKSLIAWQFCMQPREVTGFNELQNPLHEMSYKVIHWI